MAQWLELVFKLPLYQSFFYRNIATTDAETSLAGRRAAVRFGTRKLVGFIIAEYETLPESCPFAEADIKPIERIIDAEPLFTDEQAALARWMSRFYICAEGIALSAMLPSGKRETGELNTEGIELAGADFSASALTLSEEQRSAVEAISGCTGGAFCYVSGIAGCGKTEVFLQAASRALAAGKSVIYLVPEITLIHKVAESVKNRLVDR